MNSFSLYNSALLSVFGGEGFLFCKYYFLASSIRTSTTAKILRCSVSGKSFILSYNKTALG
nr:MAG TPA: hypothetical protein [Caudoviricetes sp.]